MSELKCIVIEDEPLAAKILKDYISQLTFLKLKASFKDAISAGVYLRDNSIDLIFLDIHLPGLKGMAFLKTLADPPSVIITTAYNKYAVEGFDLNVTDYLLKPFDFERFLTAVNKVKSAISTNKDVKEDKDFIFLNFQKKKVKVLYSEIIFIESQREYIKIHAERRIYLIKLSTNEIEKLLPAKYFKRIHRSYIVSLNRIESFTSDHVEINGHSIPIGRDYRGIINNLL